MGEVKKKVFLQNYGEIFAAEAGYIKKEEIKGLETEAMVDTGCVMLMLPQEMVEKLGLSILRRAIVTYVDERKEERPIAGSVKITIDDRFMITEAIVGPPLSEPLIGQVILEELDFVVDCTNQTVGPRPESPYLPLLKLK
ncbi:MAG: aspartyl protease family protein [bacterium]|nr:aspartyl protease family protein [bacterium]